MFITPVLVISCPFLAFLVGKTQSNISTPKKTASTISSGFPTPIRYLGLSSGRIFDKCFRTFVFSSLGSPTLNPPIAMPSNSHAKVRFSDSSLKSSYIPPCTIPNNADCDL